MRLLGSWEANRLDFSGLDLIGGSFLIDGGWGADTLLGTDGADRLRGGHVMGCEPDRARIGIQHVPSLELGLPLTLDFLTADLTRDTTGDLEQVEK